MFRSYRDTVRTPVKTSKEAAKKYYCDLCDDDHQDRVWASELDVEIHRRRVHNEELIQLMKEPKNYMCSVCLRKQSDKATLIAHIKTDHLLSSPDAPRVKRELFICDYCNNIFFNKLLLTAHIKFFHAISNTEKKTGNTTCPFCLKIIKIRSIWFHFLCHDIINPGTCPVCLVSFDEYQDALKHTECHPCYYYCSICTYETDKEGLFLSHIGKHKKMINLEGKDVKMVSKYFVPQKRALSWNRKVVNVFKGITLAPEIQICVLCRTLCETEEQMLHHIYGDHSPMNTVEIKRHVCACGEEFFNRVLLKHHIFMMKGNHQACDGTEMTVIMTHPETNFQDPVYNPDEGTAGFFVNIKENENTSHPIMLPNEVDHNTSSDITLKSLGNISPQMSTESRFNVNEQISEQDIDKQTEHKIDLQLLHDLNDSQEINIPSEDNIHIQTNNETNKIVIQTYNHTDTQLNNNENNLVEMDIDPEPDRLIIDSDNDIYNDQIILNANEYNFQSPNKSKEITIGTSNIRIQLVDVDDTSSHNQIPRLKKKPSNQNIILLNNTLPKKYGSSKHFYEQIVHSSDEISASEGSGQYRYVLDPAGGQMEFIEESSPNEEVYEVVELPGDPNEERIVVEEALLFS
ncbi:unnamed protein product [Arctia plantaginis]|uniref:C2H2-type domain-containing protein n=1 Tax=Arctia plantaginis TaxID=874455 RepID=A0A8S1B621_ARCPL|nr:unnamed protein product [Arctia plantaginis]